jgi:outer membrane protein assembly factor BamB
VKNTGSISFVLVLLTMVSPPAWGAPGDLKWSFPTDAPAVSSAVIGVDGTIYVGSANLASSDATYLYAVNPDGTERWRFPTGDIRRAPALCPDGKVYVVTDDDQLVAVDVGGTEKWTWTAPGISDSSVAVGFDGTIYVRSVVGVLYAVNPDGAEVWSRSFDDTLTTSPVVGPDGNVYVGCADSNLYAIDPDGEEQWSFSTVGYAITAPAIGPDGNLYFGTTGDRFYIAAGDGFHVWDFAGSGPSPQTPAIGCDGEVFFGNDGGPFWKVDPGVSASSLGGSPQLWTSAAIGAECTLYVGMSDRLRAIDPQTNLGQWDFSMGLDAHTYPVLGVDGTVYIGSHDGALYAVESESAGPACSGWPMARHDIRGGGLGMGLTARTFGGVVHDRATSIEQTPDCGYVVSGSTSSFGAGSVDAWILKLDGAGRVEWEHTYGGEGIDGIRKVHPTSDGGYLAVGGTDEPLGAGGNDAWILRLDPAGNVTWQGTYGGTHDESLNAILEMEDGFLLAGGTESFDSLNHADAWIVRLESDGTLVQQRLYGTDGGGEAASDLQPTADGGYIFTGWTYSFGVNTDAWVVKLNADLSIAWQKTYGGPEPDFGSDIRPTPQGDGYYLAGSYFTGVGDDWDAFLMKLDLLGDIVWQYSYPHMGREGVVVELAADGDLVMAGSRNLRDTPPAADGWIARIDPTGAMVWRKTYAGPDFGDYEVFSSLDLGFGGECLIVGQTDSVGIGDADMLLLRVDADGDEPTACGVLEADTVATSPSTFVTADTTATAGFSSVSVSGTAVVPGQSEGFMMDVCNPASLAIGIQRTGQVTSYVAGDDGHIQAGVAWPEPRFTDNGDGTLLDNLTGLVWLKDANCFAPAEWEATFVTTQDFNDNPQNHSCVDYVPDPDADPWRAPNLNELESLLNAEATVQSNWLIGQGFANVQPSRYWSSGTVHPENSTMGWCVDMDEGAYERRSKGLLELLWPVRGGQQNYIDFNYPANIPKTGTRTSEYPGDDGHIQWGVAWPNPRFSDLGNGTVRDNLTGLIWLQDAECVGQTDWPGAFAAVVALNAAGGAPCVTGGEEIDDWTVPNRKQLLSLMDRSESRPMLQDAHPFLNIGSYSSWWTSTVDPTQITPGGEPFAWSLSFGFGTIASEWSTSSFPYVWAVRARQGSTPSLAGLTEDLMIERATAGEITLTWSGSCLASDTDFAIYEGTLGDFTSHVPLTCSTAGLTSVTFPPSPGDVYYLVVPSNASVEGSYGVDHAGNERPPSSSACKTQSVGECPP